MDRFPPAEDGPTYEFSAIGRTAHDLTREEETAPRAHALEELIFTALALAGLLAFVGWLLVG